MFRFVFIIVLLRIVTICNCLHHASLDTNEVSLENVMKEILQISPPERPLGKFKEDQQPPKHMLELYHRFTTGRRATGETVRSISPTIDSHHHQQHQHIVVFNMSHIGADEDIRLAQLVLKRRRLSRHPHPLHRKLLAPPYRVRVYQVIGPIGGSGGRSRTVPLASIPVPQVSRGGWHSLDITSAVRELLLTSSDISDELTLGVRFEAPRSRLISPAHFLDLKKNSTSAFLMLFSEESSDNEITDHHRHKKPMITAKHIALISQHLKHIEKTDHSKQRHHSHQNKIEIDLNNPRRHKNKSVNDDTDIKELIAMKHVKSLKRHRKLFDDFNLKYDDEHESTKRTRIKSDLINELLENSETRRVIRSTDADEKKRLHRRRSIYDNELPFDKLHITADDISKSLATTEVAIPQDTVLMVTESAPPVDNDEEDGDKNLIPYPPGTERKKNRRGNRKGKKKPHRKRTGKIVDKWNSEDGLNRHYFTEAEQTNSSIISNQTCSRRHLVVNFADIGWSKWIIAPAYFNAHYCSGSCSLPIPEHKRKKIHHKKCNMQLTNHAVLQQLVHEKNKNIPSPCCVPHTMGSLTVLYLEDTESVVLKNYKSMTVESCGCR